VTFNPKCLATGIGSFPHQTAEAACDIILSTIPEMPFWPQLPKINFREQMEIQFCEGLPCIQLDEVRQRIYFDTTGDPTSQLEKFYANYMADNLDHFKISAEFSRGIYELEKKISAQSLPSIKFFKSQVTGPITFGLTIVDEKKRSIYYNELFRDVVSKGITMKAKWILKKFKPLGYNQICFVDEPILSAFGSSTFVSVQREDVVTLLSEVFETVHQEGALVGTHCCGNTEWPILIDAGADIISFDAYEFGETIAYYPDQIKGFLESGGVIAWGIVPNSEKFNQETTDSLIKKLEEKVDRLAAKGIDKNLIWDRCLLTPSCGTGSLSIELADRVFHRLADMSKVLRKE